MPTKLEKLPDTGYVRLHEVLDRFPVSKSSWYAGISSGRYPAPVKLSARTSAYHVDTIRALIAEFNAKKAA